MDQSKADQVTLTVATPADAPVAEANRAALGFWSSAVTAFAGDAAVAARRAGHGGAMWREYFFRSDAAG